VVADTQPYHDRFACDLCQPEQRPAIGSREAPRHRVVHADPVDAQRPRPRDRPLVGASVQRGTKNLMYGLREQLAVFVRQAAQVDKETRRPNMLHSPSPRSATSASIESYTLPSGMSSPGPDGRRLS
jgi:hypothetical protein